MQSPSHPESTNLTPRSRSGSWTEEPSNSTATKIRLMCSYGGKIAPRPHDKTLCYLNGDTRIVAIDKNNFSLADLVAKIGRSLPSTHPRPFVLKYQLPSEDLDSLISVTTDEDLENMIDEYDRIAEMSGNDLKPRRIRLFIFSDKKKKVGEEPEVENWFVEGLNNGGIMHKSTDSHGSSINYLLGLEEDDRSLNPSNNNHSSCSSAVTETIAMTTTPTLPAPPRQVDHFSSFDSSSSSPSSNLPPIKVRVDDNQNQRAGLEEGFAQIGIHSEQKSDENFGGNMFSHQNHPQPPQNPITTAVSLPTKLTDNITAVSESLPMATYSSADQKSPPPPPPIQPPQLPRHQDRVSQNDGDHPHSPEVLDSNYRQQQMLPNQTYGFKPQHNYEPQQYIQVPQMITMPPQSSFFHVSQPHHLYGQNGPVYYIPIQRPPNLTSQQPHPQHFAVQPQMSDSLSKSQFVGTTTQLPPHLVHIGGGGGKQPKQYVGYGYESLHYQPPATEAATIYYSQAAAAAVAVASSASPTQYQTLKSSEQPR